MACHTRRLSTRRSFVIAILALAALLGLEQIAVAQQSDDLAFPKPIIPRATNAPALGPLASPLGSRPSASPAPNASASSGSPLDVEQMLSPTGLSSTLKIMLVLTVISLAPSILIMTTCFMRFVIVFGLLRQAMGTQQLPPNQVLVSLCLFLTFLVMSPVWKEAYEDGIRPYSSPAAGQEPITLEQAFHRTARPFRRFMIEQIQRTDNVDSVLTFLRVSTSE